MAEEIKQNKQEDKEYNDKIYAFLHDALPHNSAIKIGRTPNVLAISGANQDLDLYISPNVILKITSEPDQRYHAHNLSSKTLVSLLNELRNPVMVLKGNHENSLVAITDVKDSSNRNIIISVELDSREKHFTV